MASGILLSYIFFCHPENNGTRLRSRAVQGGKIAKSRPVEKEGRADIGIERWQDWAFFCNDRI